MSSGKENFQDLRLEGNRLWGPRYEVSHLADGFRGFTPNGVLFLSEDDAGRLTGLVGTHISPTEVRFEEDVESHRVMSTNHVTARGLGISLDHETLVVQRGRCADVYHRTPDTETFHAELHCGRAGADVHIPESFFKRPASEQVVFLAILMG